MPVHPSSHKMFIVLALILFCLALWGTQNAEAVFLPSGGPILTVTPCNTGLWLVIGPPVPASLMLIPGATLVYLFGLFHPGANILALYDPVPIPCVVGTVVVGTGFHTIMIGTSL